MAERYRAALDFMVNACVEPGPFLYAISASGLRRIRLG